MKKTRFTEEQMVTILREARPEAGRGGRREARHQRSNDLRVAAAVRDARSRRLRQLKQENGRLKKMFADRDLVIDVLKEITRNRW